MSSYTFSSLREVYPAGSGTGGAIKCPGEILAAARLIIRIAVISTLETIHEHILTRMPAVMSSEPPLRLGGLGAWDKKERARLTMSTRSLLKELTLCLALHE